MRQNHQTSPLADETAVKLIEGCPPDDELTEEHPPGDELAERHPPDHKPTETVTVECPTLGQESPLEMPRRRTG